MKYILKKRGKLQSVRKLDDSKADLYSCLQILEETIAGTETFTPLRQHLISILSEIMTNSSFIEEKESIKINSMLKYIINFYSLFFLSFFFVL